MSKKYLNDQPFFKESPKTAIMIRQFRKCPDLFHLFSNTCGRQLLMLLLFSISTALAYAQTKVTGRVTDGNGEGLPGATVRVKGTVAAVQSEDDGRFAITVSNLNVTLECSFVGFVTKEMQLNGKSTVHIVLANAKNSALSEVVVVGYGTQSRASLTTSISKLDTKVLENVPYANVASALEGTIPGARVQSTSGQPGAAPRIIIRGGTSITNPNGSAPLYIIDGVIRANMNDINGDDIESIEVLKDAGSTAIYGARGSNGVVLITTRSGRSGRMNVRYGYDLSFSQVGKTYDMASAHDYIYHARLGILAAAKKTPSSMAQLTAASSFGTGNDLTENTGYTTQYLTDANKHKLDEGWESMQDPVDPSKTIIYKGTDWQDVLFRTALSHNNYISVDGGSDKATYSASLGYMTNEGTAISTKYNRLTVNLNGDLKIRDNLKVFSRVAYTSSSNNEVYSIGEVFFRSAGMAPTAKYTFEDGSLAPGAAKNIGNPAYFLNNDIIKNRYQKLTVSLGSHWDIIEGLSFNPLVSLYKESGFVYSFAPAYLNGVNNYVTTRAASSSYTELTQYQVDAVFNYRKSFANAHNLDVTAGASYIGRENIGLSASGNGAATDLIPTLNAAATPISVGGSESSLALMGYFGRINYNYKQRYLLSVTARYDGASNLGKSHQWGAFPGVSAGWRLDQEKFWSPLIDIARLKLRASYGVTGNISGLSDFQAQGSYSVGSLYMGSSAIVNSVIANPNLKWEQSQTFDIGADIGLMNERINITFDYYHRKTNDLLTTLSLPLSTGFSSIFTNLGRLENKGVEIALGLQVLPTDSKFQWDVSFNASRVKTKILKLPSNGTKNNRIGGFYVWDESVKDYAWVGGLQEGGRIGDLYAWKQIGIYSTDAEAANAPVDMTMSFADKTKYGGDVNYADKDLNGILDTRDLYYMGNTYPTWTGGFMNTFSYKGFALVVRMDYMTGFTIYNQAKIFLAGQWAGNLNFSQDLVTKGWHKSGDIAEYPQYIPGVGNYSYWRGSQNYTNGTTNSMFYESGNFLCLREVTLGYNIPSQLLQKIKIKGIRLNITGSNLYYFTKYDGMNPEDGGIDAGRYPMPRNFTIGASVTF